MRHLHQVFGGGTGRELALWEAQPGMTWSNHRAKNLFTTQSTPRQVLAKPLCLNPGT